MAALILYNYDQISLCSANNGDAMCLNLQQWNDSIDVATLVTAF